MKKAKSMYQVRLELHDALIDLLKVIAEESGLIKLVNKLSKWLDKYK